MTVTSHGAAEAAPTHLSSLTLTKAPEKTGIAGRLYCGSCFQRASVCHCSAHYVGACGKREYCFGEPMVDQSCLSQDKQEAERRGSQGPGFLFKGTFSSDLIFHQDPLPKGFNHLPGVPWAGHQASTLRLLWGTSKTQTIPRCFMSE